VGTSPLFERITGNSSHEQDEVFYIFDGEITLIAGDVRQTAKSGTLVYIPAGCVHTFRVDSETARVLNFYLPGGFPPIITEFGTPAQSRTVPPSELHESGTPEQMKALFARVGMHIVALPDMLRAERGRS
jgi:cupin domain